jgi:hypothetical protein
MRHKVAVIVASMLFLAAPVAFGQRWSGAAGAGVPDESAAGIYQVDVGGAKYNASGSTNAIVLRYVITDTSATGSPGWTTVAVDAYDPGASSQIQVKLYRLTPGGTNNMFTSCTSADSAGFSTTTCSLLNSFNFNTNDTYTAEVTLTRSSTGVDPVFRAIRLY